MMDQSAEWSESLFPAWSPRGLVQYWFLQRHKLIPAIRRGGNYGKEGQ
jgi:hypothetical protein